jgi:hypothetical protein
VTLSIVNGLRWLEVAEPSVAPNNSTFRSAATFLKCHKRLRIKTVVLPPEIFEKDNRATAFRTVYPEHPLMGPKGAGN